jgi:hypothetical protein
MLPPYGEGCTARKGGAGEGAPLGEGEGAAWLKGLKLESSRWGGCEIA